MGTCGRRWSPRALKLLEKQDLERLSLREVARNVGVSATAVYRHFPSKESLLKALAEHGLADVGRSSSNGRQRRRAGRRRLRKPAGPMYGSRSPTPICSV